MSNFLQSIQNPSDLKKLKVDQLGSLCSEIRELILQTVSQNGGHLASNLGAVELTVALHYVFDMSQDAILWDVGHQAYTHKILTGRKDFMPEIRKKGGISGFPNRKESPYDLFSVGHASTSISAALGFAQAKAIRGEEGSVVSVIGDGALTGGLAYEGLNNAGRLHRNFIVVLNDNKMSISKNVGAIARSLTRARTQRGYLRAKTRFEKFLDCIPLIGKPMHGVFSKIKNLLKHIVYGDNLFENMGFTYYGPFDGHNIREMIRVFENARAIHRPVLLHMVTAKGKGYSFAEECPGQFHGLSGFDIDTGACPPSKTSFSAVFGETLCALAGANPNICALTAAMQDGTGLSEFHRLFPERFFDVGIAEEHAVTFSGALAAAGMLPVFAVYSTFLQRAYDQILHDAALQNVRMVLAIDRAGIVGEDGETHQGVFDTAFLNSIPNLTVFAPSYFEELRLFLKDALYTCEGIAAVRYPRGGELYCPADFVPDGESFCIYGQGEICIVTYGRLFSFACRVKEALPGIRIIKLNRIRPIPPEAVGAALESRRIFFFEEGAKNGGVGMQFGEMLMEHSYTGNYFLRAIGDAFVRHASVSEALCELGLDAAGMKKMIVTECGSFEKET